MQALHPRSPACASPLLVGHLNINRLRHKTADVQQVLLDHHLDILALSETWLDNTMADGEVHIPSYTIHRLDRDSSIDRKIGGGVCFYHRNTLPIKARTDLQVHGAEIAWIELHNGQGKLLFGCCYRPPSAHVDFWNLLNHSLELVQRKSSADRFYLLGDFNVDVSNPHAPQLNRLNETLQQFSLINIIHQPTRITASSATVIDLVLTEKNMPQVVSDSNFCEVHHLDISDHSLIQVSLRTYLPVQATHHNGLQRRRPCYSSIKSKDLSVGLARANLETFLI